LITGIALVEMCYIR